MLRTRGVGPGVPECWSIGALLGLVALVGCSPGDIGSLYPQSPTTAGGLCRTSALGWTIEPVDPENPGSGAYFALPEIELRVGQTLALRVQTVAFGCKVAPYTTSYTGSNADVARVFEASGGWRIEAIAPGEMTVTAQVRSDDGERATSAPKLFRVVP